MIPSLIDSEGWLDILVGSLRRSQVDNRLLDTVKVSIPFQRWSSLEVANQGLMDKGPNSYSLSPCLTEQWAEWFVS